MPYYPPHYGARDDWDQTILNPGGNAAGSWPAKMSIYWTWRKQNSYEIEQAWEELGLSRDHALKAFSSQPPRPDNNSGVVPPEIAEYVFARSLAEKVHYTTRFKVESAALIPVRMDQDTRSFTAPRYKPREYWQWTLENKPFEEGTWQSDLVRYWRLRKSGRSEEQAWERVAMSPEHARLAMSTEAETATNDSGLIPCYQDGAYIETVAQRVLARAASMEVDSEDIYEKLKLKPTVVVRREAGPEHAAPNV